MSDIKFVKSIDKLLEMDFMGDTIHLPLEKPKKIMVYQKEVPFSIAYSIFGQRMFNEKVTSSYLQTLENVTDMKLNFDQLTKVLEDNALDNNIQFYGLSFTDLDAYETLMQKSNKLEFLEMDDLIISEFKKQAAKDMANNISLSSKRDNVIYLDDTIYQAFEQRTILKKFNAQG
ncbi:MAG: hypothetical protein ACMXX9_03240 [Candidatus Woesearchaeota archaeon]